MNAPLPDAVIVAATTSSSAEPSTDEDGAAVLAVRAGDCEAYRGLVRRHQARLLSLLAMLTRDRQAAEEIAQDAFLAAYRNLERFDPRRPFYPWLATIAVRLAQTWLRRVGTRQALAPTTADAGVDLDGAQSNAAPAPLHALVADERAQRLWRRVEALSSGERAAVMLHYRQQMSVEETAAQLGVATGTVKTLLFRARRKLRELYAQDRVNESEGSHP